MGDSGEEPERKVVNLGTFVVSCTCATLGLMVSACFLIFHVYHRKNKVVRMSSPYMNIVTNIGGILLSTMCFLYGLEYFFQGKTTPLTVLCKTRLWVIVPSVTLIFGPVATKLWRVHEIFKYGLAKKVVIKDRRLFLILFGLLSVDAILLTLWQTIDPVKVKTTWFQEKNVADYDNPLNATETFSYLLQECVCNKLEVWITVITIWKFAVIVSSLFYSWKIRSVPVPSLNDSSQTFAAIFIGVILTFSATIISMGLRSHPNALYVITCIAVVLSVILIQTTLFMPKVRQWWKTPENVTPRISSTSLKTPTIPTESHDPPPDVNGNLYSDDGLLDIVEENKALKESLLEKETLISALQGHLDSAKEKLSRFKSDIQPDCGIDSGLEGGPSTEDIYDTLRIVDLPLDRSKAYMIDPSPRGESGTKPEGYTTERTQLKIDLRYTPSISASSRHSFVDEFTDIGLSIADELNTAANINTELKKSLSRDMDRSFSETEWLYECREPRELAGSIAQSYNLEENHETFSHLNSFLPRENNVWQVRKTRRTSTSSAMSWQSMENVSNHSVEPDNISCDVTSGPRDSATPNSQQHAAILRYYSYRHINDGFKRFQNTFKFNSDLESQPNTPRSNTNQNNLQVAVSKDKPGRIYSVPRVHRQTQLLRTNTGAQKDSFV